MSDVKFYLWSDFENITDDTNKIDFGYVKKDLIHEIPDKKLSSYPIYNITTSKKISDEYDIKKDLIESEFTNDKILEPIHVTTSKELNDDINKIDYKYIKKDEMKTTIVNVIESNNNQALIIEPKRKNCATIAVLACVTISVVLCTFSGCCCCLLFIPALSVPHTQ